MSYELCVISCLIELRRSFSFVHLSDDEHLAFVVVECRRADAPMHVLRSTLRQGLPCRSVRELIPVEDLNVRTRNRSRSGWWWSSTNRSHVPYSSTSELDVLVLLDSLPRTRWIAHSPIRITDDTNVALPPYVVETEDGFELVENFLEPDEANSALIAVAASGLGWKVLSPAHTLNRETLLWLAGFRHQRCLDSSITEQILGACSRPRAIGDLVDQFDNRPGVLPSVFHLMWNNELRFGEAQLSMVTQVWAPST